MNAGISWIPEYEAGDAEVEEHSGKWWHETTRMVEKWWRLFCRKRGMDPKVVGEWTPYERTRADVLERAGR